MASQHLYSFRCFITNWEGLLKSFPSFFYFLQRRVCFSGFVHTFAYEKKETKVKIISTLATVATLALSTATYAADDASGVWQTEADGDGNSLRFIS